MVVAIKLIKKTKRSRHRSFGVLPQRGLLSAASLPTLSTYQRPKTITIESTSNAIGKVIKTTERNWNRFFGVLP